jgi:hypothetical protein
MVEVAEAFASERTEVPAAVTDEPFSMLTPLKLALSTTVTICLPRAM